VSRPNRKLLYIDPLIIIIYPQYRFLFNIPTHT